MVSAARREQCIATVPPHHTPICTHTHTTARPHACIAQAVQAPELEAGEAAEASEALERPKDARAAAELVPTMDFKKDEEKWWNKKEGSQMCGEGVDGTPAHKTVQGPLLPASPDLNSTEARPWRIPVGPSPASDARSPSNWQKEKNRAMRKPQHGWHRCGTGKI